MASAAFRFYAELNDFLPPQRRQREFACRYAQDATVKHMIEALGVPHTEVALILLNGAPAGFGQRLHDGDRVAVYPRFASLDPGALPQLGPAPPQPPRFIADAHLGGLARLLRMAGFDTLYDNHCGDGEIEAIAARDGRIVLTRDRELLKRRQVVHGCYLHAQQPPRQLREVAGRFGLAEAARPFTRCLDCNRPLRTAARAEVEARLPPSVRARHDRFSTCDSCRRVYWKGSHWQRMRAALQQALPP